MLINRNGVYYEDIEYIWAQLTESEKNKLAGSKLLITGCAGFLGFYIMSFFHEYYEELKIQKIVGVDNFLLGQPDWMVNINNPVTEFVHMDISNLSPTDVEILQDSDYVIHMASIASPSYYRQHPVETVDANVWGLRSLLEMFKSSENPRGFLFFSSSEVYGDPAVDRIPISEEYCGNVRTIGPRACYDEAKRFGETICYIYTEKFGLPITIARPFNNYGPGMKLNDSRVPADFAKAVLLNEPIRIYSDGNPTRTYCYIADAIAGYLKVLLYDSFDVFNIGIDRPEISVSRLATIYQEAGQEIFDHKINIEYCVSEDAAYLIHNPARRCPDLSKARSILGFAPSIGVETGVRRFLRFLQHQGGF